MVSGKKDRKSPCPHIAYLLEGKTGHKTKIRVSSRRTKNNQGEWQRGRWGAATSEKSFPAADMGEGLNKEPLQDREGR